uniref:Uncharacterized protein n=1 Tax=Medicago truncatula TaxID=3880 RepID=A2Q1J6_MEDTR|nr:hypothetical protein MtrDRAFT_AC148915g23v2 [Medicago truncatula]
MKLENKFKYEAVRRATIAEKFIPVFMGSAYKYKVIVELP